MGRSGRPVPRAAALSRCVYKVNSETLSAAAQGMYHRMAWAIGAPLKNISKEEKHPAGPERGHGIQGWMEP